MLELAAGQGIDLRSDDKDSGNEKLDSGKIMTEVLPAIAGAANESRDTKNANLPGLEIILGASGAEAPAHAGFLQAIEDKKVPVKFITGVSGGSLVAALYANDYSPEQIKEILMSNEFRYPKPYVLAQCLHLADPWNLYPYAIDFRPWINDFVDTYKLKPQENLRIVATDAKTLKPVVFEGTNYDLVTALSASTAASIGLNMKPVEQDGRKLIDGFYYHPIPASVAKEAPAIISKVGFVSQFPKEFLNPWDTMMHLREMAYYNVMRRMYPDPAGHIIAKTGLDDVATTTFGISRETMERLVKHGYDSTMERLSQPDAVKAIEKARPRSS